MTEKMTSSDGILEITRSSITYPGMGPKSVQGAIKNHGKEAVNAEISVDLYDMEDNLLGSASAVFNDIQPGESKIFDVWAERLPNMYEIEYHKIKSVSVV